MNTCETRALCAEAEERVVCTLGCACPWVPSTSERDGVSGIQCMPSLVTESRYAFGCLFSAQAANLLPARSREPRSQQKQVCRLWLLQKRNCCLQICCPSTQQIGILRTQEICCQSRQKNRCPNGQEYCWLSSERGTVERIQDSHSLGPCVCPLTRQPRIQC